MSRLRHFVTPSGNGQGAILLPSYMLHPIRGVNLAIHCERGDDNLNDARSLAPSKRAFVHGQTLTEYIAFNGGRQLQKGLSQVAAAPGNFGNAQLIT